MEIVVIGMGYVGIPTAAMFANVKGFNVIGVQRRSERSAWKIDLLNAGKCPIGGDEPGLAELIGEVVRRDSFHVTDDMSVCEKAGTILVDVQTPVDENHVPQYAPLEEVCEALGHHMSEGAMIILESTVVPGTTTHIVKPMLEEYSKMKAGIDFNLVYSYERVMVGRLLYNMVNMPRVVGGYTPKCAKRGAEFYKHIVNAEIFPTDCLTAEVAKVVENTYRDVNIAFANEVALICESLGVNFHEVRRLVNSLPYDPSDPSKNPYRMIHTPGAGVGGHCLPKDPWLLKYGLDAFGASSFRPRVLIESRRINDSMPQHMKDLTEDALREKGMKMRDARICILGFAFLGDSDDTRNTPALALYSLLKDKCRGISVHDPYVKEYKDVVLTNDLEEALRNKDCVIAVTRHKQYLGISLNWLKNILATPIIVDGRNVFDPQECMKAGFCFRGIGVGLQRR